MRSPWWLAIALLPLTACSTPQVTAVPIEECSVTWDEAALPETVRQWCTVTDEPQLKGETIHDAQIRGETVSGDAAIIRMETPVRMDQDQVNDIDLTKGLGGKVEWLGPERTMLTPWGEEARVREFRFTHLEEEHLCVLWTALDYDKGYLRGAKSGYVCSADDPYTVLKAVQYGGEAFEL